MSVRTSWRSPPAPPPHVRADETGPEKFRARNRGIVDNFVPANFLTLCAATLPVGLQLIARGGEDERLVSVACAAERVLGAPRDLIGTAPMR